LKINNDRNFEKKIMTFFFEKPSNPPGWIPSDAEHPAFGGSGRDINLFYKRKTKFDIFDFIV